MEVLLKPRNPAIPSTWRFIRTWLLVTGGDYCYRVWKAFSKSLVEEHGQRPPTYQSFSRYWWNLKQLGLIEPLGRPRKSKGGKPLQLYRVVPGRESEKEWPKNPQFEMYGEKVRLGKRRYKRRVLGIPPLPSGRPRREIG